MRQTRTSGLAPTAFATATAAAALAVFSPLGTSVAWAVQTIDSDINITDSAHFPPPGGNSVGFPASFVPTGQVDTRGAHAWNAYTGAGSVFNQAIGLGWG